MSTAAIYLNKKKRKLLLSQWDFPQKNTHILYIIFSEKKTKLLFIESTERLKNQDCHGTPADAELSEGSDAGAEIPAGGASGRFPHHSGGGVGPLQLGGGHLWPSKHTL